MPRPHPPSPTLSAMRVLVDCCYLIGVVITMPIWLVRMIAAGKYRTDWPGRFGHLPELSARTGPRVLLHAVSVGEVNATRELIAQLREARPDIEIVIATTTNTGFARAQALFADDHHVVRYPFDFSRCVRRFLRAIDPSVVALVELEVWPNFTAECARRGILIGVINGRLTARSAMRYRWVKLLVTPAFGRLSFCAVQTEPYAERFRALGVRDAALSITGTMKWDTARIADDVEGAAQLAGEMGIGRTRPLIVAGSTAPDEETLLHRATPEDVQLLCAPRRPEWFDEAANALPGCARRSRGDTGSDTGRFLLDTIGELRRAYALADLVIIGRSFVNLYGSDMMEPIALGKATIVGPNVSDFQDTVDALLAGDGLIQTNAKGLAEIIRALLDDPDRRAALARNGRAVIERHQGASARHAEIILSFLPP